MRLIVVLLLLVSSPALASEDPSALVDALDLAPSLWSNLSTSHPDAGASDPRMFDVRSDLGVIEAGPTGDMALLSTGDVDNIVDLVDFDFPPGGSQGDQATLSFDLSVPPGRDTLVFFFFFLSREYPEWVGDIYNDTFEVNIAGSAWTGNAVLDHVGNTVSVNSAYFVVTAGPDLQGTGFDSDGGTGWCRTEVPVTPGSTVSISFEIRDEGDGVWDSAVLLDNIAWDTTGITEPSTVEAPADWTLDFNPPGDDDDATGDDDDATGDDDDATGDDDDATGDDDDAANDDDSAAGPAPERQGGERGDFTVRDLPLCTVSGGSAPGSLLLLLLAVGRRRR